MRIVRLDNVPYAFGIYCIAVGYFCNPARPDFAALITFIPGIVFIFALAMSYGINLYHRNFYVSLVMSFIALAILIAPLMGVGQTLKIMKYDNMLLILTAIWLLTGFGACISFSKRLNRHWNLNA